jgi:glycosidase
MLRSDQLYLFIFLFIINCFFSCAPKKINNSSSARSNSTEVIYHVFQRSFYDSNDDNIGDLKGLQQKLDYLQALGVTSILLLPLYESVYYHNYYTNDFYKIDPEFGTMEDYLSLVKDVHRRGMKVYMDMETQYVTEDHEWYKSAVNNLQSPYSDYILFKDSAHKIPETFVFNLTGWTGYNGDYKKITTVNLNNKKVLEYNINLYKFWVDPNKDGKFDDGVDGFRFDHMMNDLDRKPQLTGLFKNFWVPLISELKKVNPNLTNVAEQAEWNSWGEEYLEKADVDRIFSFKLMGAIRSFKKSYLSLMADSAFNILPRGKQQIFFIENHDLPRFSTSVGRSLPKMKIGAALNLLIGGVPSIYYGQELGMSGAGSWGKWGMNDGNEIPEREAFDWYRSDTGRGMAIWYKNSGPWWDSTNLKPNDGISLEEEMPDSNSLFNFYKKMIDIRKNNPVISEGKYETLVNTNNSVFSFRRYDSENEIIVVVNLSDTIQQTDITYQDFNPKKKQIKLLNGTAVPVSFENKIEMFLPSYGINVYHLKTKNQERN